jgi:hypothetical protein
MNRPTSHYMNTVTFPLSSDHLLTLVQFNVLKGSISNRDLLDNALRQDGQFISTMDSESMHVLRFQSSHALANVPPCLQPTLLQQTTPHPIWIDIFPHPTLRDNLILLDGTFDADQLWLDVVGGLFEGMPDEGEPQGMMMWETPWTWKGWELTEGFVKKWGWMLQGCKDLIDETNRRRQERDEERITVIL